MSNNSQRIWTLSLLVCLCLSLLGYIFLINYYGKFNSNYVLNSEPKILKICMVSKYKMLFSSKDGESIKRPINENEFIYPKAGWIDIHICEDGEIVFSLDGKMDFGQLPYVNISLKNKIYHSGYIKSKDVKIIVRKDENIRISFINASTRVSSRIAEIEKISFKGKDCGSYDVVHTKETGGIFNSDQMRYSLVFSHPMVIYPCSKGNLRFIYKGYPANGSYPILNIESAKISTLQSDNSFKAGQIFTDGTPIRIGVANPYSKVDGIRTLSLKDIYFVPAGGK